MIGYIWDPAWCWPYESAWSIMEKFKYANAVTNEAFKEIFGHRNSSTGWNVMESLYIYRRSKLDDNDFFKFFQLKDNHFSYLNAFCNNDFKQLFHEELHYCPECMKLGYHSYLHQLSFVDSCPFHHEKLLIMRYKDKVVPYSIDITRTEAYCAMRAIEKQPAERYIDILPSNKLIDGIWQIAPNNIKMDVFTTKKIIFFNPSIEPSETLKPFKNNTFKLINCLRKDTCIMEFMPVFQIDTTTCDFESNGLLARIAEGFDLKYHAFNKSSQECWFIAELISKSLQDTDKDILQKSIDNMQRRNLYHKIDREEYLKTAASVITAYIATNARNLYDGINKSIFYHYYSHNDEIRCPFMIFDIETYINGKGLIDNYLPLLIFARLFNRLYEHILMKLRANIELTFNYHNISADLNIPDYVIAKKDDCYEVFEIE